MIHEPLEILPRYCTQVILCIIEEIHEFELVFLLHL
jgi:hypothetical protein